jgi:hypothetical protein
MEELVKRLFGEKDSLTIDEFTKAATGLKLYALADGGYVKEEKFQTEADKLKKANDELKALREATDGDEGLKRQVATLTEQLTTANTALTDTGSRLTAAERTALVADKAAYLAPKMRRMLIEDAKALTSETVDFSTALDKVLAEDADYAAPAPSDDGTPAPVIFASGAPTTGKPATAEDPIVAAVAAKLGSPIK